MALPAFFLEAELEVLVADLLRLVPRIWHLGNQGFLNDQWVFNATLATLCRRHIGSVLTVWGKNAVIAR